MSKKFEEGKLIQMNAGLYSFRFIQHHLKNNNTGSYIVLLAAHTASCAILLQPHLHSYSKYVYLFVPLYFPLPSSFTSHLGKSQPPELAGG